MRHPSIRPPSDLRAAHDSDTQQSAAWRDALVSALQAADARRVHERTDRLGQTARDLSITASAEGGSSSRASPLHPPGSPPGSLAAG